jgi:hypothetical protein
MKYPYLVLSLYHILLDLTEATTMIKEIWADNVNKTFEEIEMVIHSGATLFVGLDTEFCRMDGVIDPRGAPTSAEMH